MERPAEDPIHVADADVVQQAAIPVDERRCQARLGAIAGRAEAGDLFVDAEVVALAEEREEIVGVVREGRQRAVHRGRCPVDDRRDRVRRVLADRRRTGVPGALAREPREVWIPGPCRSSRPA